jgi:hypothetical protein
MAEVRTTQQSVIVEYEGEGLRTTQQSVIVEFEAREVRATGYSIIIEYVVQTLDFYAVGNGADLPAALLTRLEPQPQCKGVQFTRFHTPNDNVQDESLFLVFEFPVLESAEEYRAVLTQFGLLNALQNEITCTARDDRGVWQRWSGMAVRPRQGEDVRWQNFFPRAVGVVVSDVRLAT